MNRIIKIMKKTIVGMMMFLMLVMGFNCLCFAESGGVTAVDTVPARNITLKPIITARSYSITYNLNGGTVTDENPTSYNIDSGDITLHNPTKEGYEFTGWTGSNGFMPSKSVTIQSGKTGDLSFTANWIKSIDIIYLANGGTGSMSNGTKLHGQAYTIAACDYIAPTKSHGYYEFDGWNTQADGNGTDYDIGSSYIKDENLTLYAKWKWVQTEYEVRIYSASSSSDAFQYGSYLGDSETGDSGSKSIKYTKPDGTTAYYNPYRKRITYTDYDSFVIKSGTDLVFNMIGGNNLSTSHKISARGNKLFEKTSSGRIKKEFISVNFPFASISIDDDDTYIRLDTYDSLITEPQDIYFWTVYLNGYN